MSDAGGGPVSVDVQQAERLRQLALRATVLALLDLLAGQAEQIERLTRDRDNLRDALQQIADSYPWQPFASDEVIRIGGAVRGWTNRRIARAALRLSREST